jgi:hypothetical protein
VIEDGVTGFIVDSNDEAVEAVKQLNTLDRRRVRGAFEQRFTARRMAEDYLRLYNALTRRERASATVVAESQGPLARQRPGVPSEHPTAG